MQKQGAGIRMAMSSPSDPYRLQVMRRRDCGLVELSVPTQPAATRRLAPTGNRHGEGRRASLTAQARRSLASTASDSTTGSAIGGSGTGANEDSAMFALEKFACEAAENGAP